jgi:hypothetical protein
VSRWKKEDPKPDTIYMRGWLQTDEGKAYRKKHADYAREWRKKNREKFRATQKRAQQSTRLEALQHYSKEVPKCACCGEQGIPFLTIDHINGDGAAHRREIGMAQGNVEQVERQKQKVSMGGNGFVYWLKKNNWPEGFQVLCANCNFAKRSGAECPHQTARRNAV